MRGYEFVDVRIRPHENMKLMCTDQPVARTFGISCASLTLNVGGTSMGQITDQ